MFTAVCAGTLLTRYRLCRLYEELFDRVPQRFGLGTILQFPHVYSDTLQGREASWCVIGTGLEREEGGGGGGRDKGGRDRRRRRRAGYQAEEWHLCTGT